MPPSAVQFTPPIESLPSFADGILFTLYAVVAMYVIFTAIFYYHWQQYSSNQRVTWITFAIYLGTTLPITFVMCILALTI